MKNPVILEHEFVFPEFTPIDETIKGEMEAILAQDQPFTFLEKQQKTEDIGSRHLSLGLVTYEEQKLLDRTFRIYAQDWHIDRMVEGSELSLVSSSTGTMFAAGKIVVRDELRRHTAGIRGMELTDVADALWALESYAGEDWLESFYDARSGLNTYRKLDELVSFYDLSVIQASPYAVARGSVNTTLHKGGLRSISEPTTRIIAINHS